MHGLINRGLQCYIRDIHGVEVWEETCERAKLPFYSFESMLVYDDATTEDMLRGICDLIDRPRDEILEDFGTYVVSEAALTAVRRLLKFGGDTYQEFLYSLNFVYDRAKLAIPDLDVPIIEVTKQPLNQFTIRAQFFKRGYGAVLLGLLRALADDYGALVSVAREHRALKHTDEDIYHIHVFEENWRSCETQEGQNLL